MMIKVWLAFVIGLLVIFPSQHASAEPSIELRDAQIQVQDMFKRRLYVEAVPYAEEAIRISAIEYGTEHPTTATLMFNLGKLFYLQSRYEEAEPMYKRALMIRESVFGNAHPEVAATYNSLGRLYDEQGQLIDAESYYSRALDVMTLVLADNPHIINSNSRTASTYRAQAYHNRARLFHQQGKYADADNLFGAALVIMRSTFGEKHAEVARGYENYAMLLRDMGRIDEAKEKEGYARTIRSRSR